MTITAHKQLQANFDPTLLQFGDVRKYQNSAAPFLPVTYNGNSLQLETCTVPMPFGVGVYEETGEKSIDISFNNPTPEVEQLREKMEQVDEMVFNAVQERHVALLGKAKTREVLEDAHNKIVKEAKKKEYGFSMKVKWPKLGPDNKNKAPSFFNAERQEVDENYCVNNSRGKLIMELRPVYAVSGRFGVKWVVLSVLVEEVPMTLSGCAFSPASPSRQALPAIDIEEEDNDIDY